MAQFKDGYVGRLPEGTIYCAAKSAVYRKSSLAAYRQKETSENVVTHVQVCGTTECHFLKSYGLDSWMIMVRA
jgi:NADH:ubiquinone oxidoreductase subunit E